MAEFELAIEISGFSAWRRDKIALINLCLIPGKRSVNIESNSTVLVGLCCHQLSSAHSLGSSRLLSEAERT
jgi:hypothetical protein